MCGMVLITFFFRKKIDVEHHLRDCDNKGVFGATCQRGAGQTLDMKSNLCPSSVQCLSKLCPTSVQVQGLSSRCPGQVHSLSKLCLRSVHLQTPWTGIGHTGPVFVQFLSSRGSKFLFRRLDKLWTNIVWTQTPCLANFWLDNGLEVSGKSKSSCQ